MKKLSLLFAMVAFLAGNVFAQTVLINDDFEAYTVGNKIAVEAQAAGHDWWTTWTNQPGSNEDGVVAEAGGTKCGYISGSNDNVLLLGGQESGTYDLEFAIYCETGKYGYFNILHEFNAGGSTWAMQAYLNATNNGQSTTTYSVGHGTVHAGGNGVADIPGVVEEWMFFRIRVDTDLDQAELFYRTETTYPEEMSIWSWQWSLDSFGTQATRKMDAMDFYAPNAALGRYYLDNFVYTRIGEETHASLDFSTEAVAAYVAEDDVDSYDITNSNAEGTSIGDWAAWIDFGTSTVTTGNAQLNYDAEPGENTALVGLQIENPELIEVAAMFPGAAYAGAAMGTKIVSAQYALYEGQSSGLGIEANTPLTFRIYKQGLHGMPGEVIAEKAIPYGSIVSNDWNVATFDSPIDLTGYNVWVSCEFTQAVSGYPMNFDGGEPAEYGDFYRTNGGGIFNKASEVFSTVYGNFHLRINTVGTPVSATWANLSKTEGSMAIGASDELTINVNAVGLSTGDEREANIIFITNDPDHEEVTIPLTLTVTGDAVIETAENAFNIYPNPTTGMVTVEGENISAVAIYSAAGQLINVVRDNKIDMSVYGAGVYFFNVIDNANNTTVQRVVVK